MSGSLATKYLLFRDRKGLVTSFVAMLGYLLMFNFLLFYIADVMGGQIPLTFLSTAASLAMGAGGALATLPASTAEPIG